ncbi:MAG: sigma-70 family RNA polymerase sigma factor [Actinomycetota bacterium]
MTPIDAAFEELHRTFFHDVRRFIERRVRDRQLAEDLAQETFLRAYRARASLDPSRPPWPWLQAIARNLVINTLRDGGRRPQMANEVRGHHHRLSAPHPETHPDAWFADAERREAIEDSLAQLSARERRVLLLRCRYDLSYQQIAKTEDLTIDALKSLLKRARLRFRVAYAKLNDEVEALVLFPLLRGRCTSRLMSLTHAPASVASVVVEFAMIATIVGVSLGSTPGTNDAPAGIGTPVARSRVTSFASPADVGKETGRSPADPDDVSAPVDAEPVRARVSGGITDEHADRKRIDVDRRDQRPGRDEEEGSTFFIELPISGDVVAIPQAIGR